MSANNTLVIETAKAWFNFIPNVIAFGAQRSYNVVLIQVLDIGTGGQPLRMSFTSACNALQLEIPVARL